MKKVLSLLLVAAMCLTFAACGESKSQPTASVVPSDAAGANSDPSGTPVVPSESNGTVPTSAPAPTVSAAAQAVADYLAANRDKIVQSFAASFGSNNIEIKAVDTGLVFDVRVSQFDQLTDDQLSIVQEAFDAQQATFDSMLPMVQTDLPELTYITFNFYNTAGTYLATLTAK
ncbi:MAG: hypothetical protein E7527_06585 [Ruminococcaceae bacterium]|nr:hypothetical protein [Oscillospiraceae bacterium]